MTQPKAIFHLLNKPTTPVQSPKHRSSLIHRVASLFLIMLHISLTYVKVNKPLPYTPMEEPWFQISLEIFKILGPSGTTHNHLQTFLCLQKYGRSVELQWTQVLRLLYASIVPMVPS